MKRLLSITLSIIMLISAMAFIAPTPARADTLVQPTMRALRADELSPYVDATTALSHGHVARVYAEEDLNTIVYRNLDGTKTAYFFDYNVKYVDENGATKDKDITLATKAGGFGLTQSDISLTIPTDITNGVEFSHNGNYIKLTPLRESIIEESLSTSAAALNKPQSAVKDTVKNEISYQKAFGNNTSLRYVPTMEGIKEEIILSSYTGTTAWRFLATTNGLTPYLDSNGTYYFAESENSAEKYSLGEVYTYDSVGNYTYGTMTVTEVKPAQQYIITLNVDEEFLTADSTVYPVYVDPTITVPGAGISDAVVYSKSPTDDHGNVQSMYIGYYDNDSYGTARVLMRMDSLINNGTFHNYADIIVSATLTLNFTSVASGWPIDIHRVTNINWTEGEANWNNASSYNSTVLKSFTPVAGSNNVDIKSIVSTWKANESYLRGGIMLKMSTEPTTQRFHMLKSSEYTNTSYRPTLTIQYKRDFNKFFNLNMSIGIGNVDENGNEKNDIIGKATNPFPGTVLSYSSANEYVATVSSTGSVTGISVGTTTITVRVSEGGIESTFDSTIVVGTIDSDCSDRSSMFDTLVSNDGITENEIVRTGDGFYLSTASVGAICDELNIPLADNISVEGKTININDIYFYCAGVDDEVLNGLILMNINAAGSKVSVSFIGFDGQKLTNCILSNTTSNILQFKNELIRALNPYTDVDCVLSDYFGQKASDAPYLIAEIFVQKVVENSFNGNTLALSSTVTSAIGNQNTNSNNNMKNALDKYSNGIYSVVNGVGTITISDRDCLSYNEKNLILMSHTGNTSFHSFAMEIVLHADTANYVGLETHTRIADMSISDYCRDDYIGTHKAVLSWINLNVGGCVSSHINYSYVHNTNRW